MSLDLVSSGCDVPHDIHVIVEIPSSGDPVKYEVDKISRVLYVDRFLDTAMHYPTNYGYIPHTLSEDGDPADVLVVTPLPLISGSVVRCRPIGVLRMEDDAGLDAKILAVPVDKLTRRYRNVKSYTDMQPELIERITHFFEHYKDLEPGKWVKLKGWGGIDEARQEILDAVARFQKTKR